MLGRDSPVSIAQVESHRAGRATLGDSIVRAREYTSAHGRAQGSYRSTQMVGFHRSLQRTQTMVRPCFGKKIHRGLRQGDVQRSHLHVLSVHGFHRTSWKRLWHPYQYRLPALVLYSNASKCQRTLRLDQEARIRLPRNGTWP